MNHQFLIYNLWTHKVDVYDSHFHIQIISPLNPFNSENLLATMANDCQAEESETESDDIHHQSSKPSPPPKKSSP